MASEYSGSITPTRPGTTPRTPRDQRREAGEINKSLSQLALVIQRLTGPTATSVQYVPYRDSMLTRLLAESFGGNSKTCLIITCSCASKDREETRCSLEFGKRAKLVKNTAEINLEVAHESKYVMRALVAKQFAEMQRETELLMRERELMLVDHEAVKQRLSKAEGRLQVAVADALGQQEQRASEVRKLEEEKAA